MSIKEIGKSITISCIPDEHLKQLELLAQGMTVDAVAQLNGKTFKQFSQELRSVRRQTHARTVTQLILLAAASDQVNLEKLIDIELKPFQKLTELEKRALLRSIEVSKVQGNEKTYGLYSGTFMARNKMGVPTDALAIIRALNEGELSEEEVKSALLAKNQLWDELTSRQKQTVEAIATGTPFTRLALDWNTDKDTVGKHAFFLRQKLDAISNHQAVLLLVDEGTLDPRKFTDTINVPGFDEASRDEKKVLDALVIGKGKFSLNDEIAHCIKKSPNTTQKSLTDLYYLTSSNTRTQLALGYIAAGLYQIVEPTQAMQPYIDIWNNTAAA